MQVLMAYDKFQKERSSTVEVILAEETRAPEKLIYSAMERDYNNGYIEFGVSIRTGWLTEKGESYLNNSK